MTKEISKALNVCAEARLTLAGKRKGVGFWQMPHGADFILECWKQNMARARRIRAAIADTHPKDGDVKQAPLVSGGGAGTAIAQPSAPLDSHSNERTPNG